MRQRECEQSENSGEAGDNLARFLTKDPIDSSANLRFVVATHFEVR